MKKLYEKTISDMRIEGHMCGSCGAPSYVFYTDIRQWAIAIVKEISRIGEKSYYPGEEYFTKKERKFLDETEGAEDFLMKRFKITKEELE